MEHHFIRYHVARGNIVLNYVESKFDLVDVFIKLLAISMFSTIRREVGFCTIKLVFSYMFIFLISLLFLYIFLYNNGEAYLVRKIGKVFRNLNFDKSKCNRMPRKKRNKRKVKCFICNKEGPLPSKWRGSTLHHMGEMI